MGPIENSPYQMAALTLRSVMHGVLEHFQQHSSENMACVLYQRSGTIPEKSQF